MGKTLDNVYKHQSLVYKYFLYGVSVFLIVFFFPRGGKFKYEFQKGNPWQYEDLMAPMDFSIKKSPDEIAREQQTIRNNKTDYYTYDATVVSKVKQEIDYGLNTQFTSQQRRGLVESVNRTVENIYAIGLFEQLPREASLVVVKNNEAQSVGSNSYLDLEGARVLIKERLSGSSVDGVDNAIRLVQRHVRPNLFHDKDLTNGALNEELSKISHTRGEISDGNLIISKGEIVDGEDLKILNSLKDEYESNLWQGGNYVFIISGYTILVALVLLMLLFFVKRYRHEIYRNNNKLTFIFFNILLMVFATTLMVKHYEDYVYVVPLCILPLVLKNFFDSRLGLFTHVLTVLILGFVVPNSFEYIFLQIITGIVTILTGSELYKRANLFISVGQITLIYIVGYFAFHTIHEGNLDNISWILFGVFILNGLLTLFAQPLIYIYEKLF